jgi:hypothetical protein
MADLVYVGAPRDTVGGFRRGAVYVYRSVSDSLVLQQRITNSAAGHFSGFGGPIVTLGNYLLIGAPSDHGVDFMSGAAYLYELVDGEYILKYKIQAADAYQYYEFGRGLSIKDEYIFIGAPASEINGFGSGVVYQYRIEKDSASFIRKFTGSNVSEQNLFGGSISVFENLLVVGAPGGVSSYNYQGSVYIFEITEDSVVERHLIKPDTLKKQYFGTSFKLIKDTLLVGAMGEPSPGRGYLYVNRDSQWVQEKYFEASDGNPGESFGVSCDKDGSRYVFGAIRANSNKGAVYVYEPITMGIEEDLQRLPGTYILEQNYPNPFNPVTTIKFSIPALTPSLSLGERVSEGRVRVTLKVYDVLGREVAILVNEAKEPGIYEVKWDASGFPSGIYFYRLAAGSFTETKKMVLLK